MSEKVPGLGGKDSMAENQGFADTSRSVEMVPGTSHREVSRNPGEILPSLPPPGGEGGREVSLQAPGFPGQNGSENTSRWGREVSAGEILPSDASRSTGRDLEAADLPRLAEWLPRREAAPAPSTPPPRPSPFVTTEGLEAAMAAIKALGPMPPEIEFFEAFGDVVVVARRGNVREPLGRMTREQFEALKARLRAGEGAR